MQLCGVVLVVKGGHGVGGRAAEAVDVEHFAVCSATVCDDVSLVSACVVVAIVEHKSALFSIV